MERNTPRLGRPKPLSPLRSIPVYPSTGVKSNNGDCNMDSCFDYSLCPLSSKFQFYLYPYMYSNLSFISLPKEELPEASDGYFSGSNVQILHDMFSRSLYRTREYSKACLFVLIVDNCDPRKLKDIPDKLPNWFGDGRNHVIWLDCGIQFRDIYSAEFKQNFGRAMVLSETGMKNGFRQDFDLIVNHWGKAIPSGEIWSHLPPIVPAKRKYLATYLGTIISEIVESNPFMNGICNIKVLILLIVGGETDQNVQTELLKIQQDDPLSFVFQFSCFNKWKAGENEINSLPADDNPKSAKNIESYAQKKLSSLCENDLLRTRLLLDSTFSLLILSTPGDGDVISSDVLQLRLYESLKYGSIPVVIGTRFVPPLNEVLDWSKILIMVPSSRVTELHYILKSFVDADLIEMRKQGRLVFEKYFSSVESIAESVLAVLRTRIGLPPLPFRDLPSPKVFNDSFTVSKLEAKYVFIKISLMTTFFFSSIFN